MSQCQMFVQHTHNIKFQSVRESIRIGFAISCFHISYQIHCTISLNPSLAHVLIFLQKEATVSLLFITSGMLFQSMLPLKHMDFMPKATVDVLGSKTMSFILRLYLSLSSIIVQTKIEGSHDLMFCKSPPSAFVNSEHGQFFHCF